MHKEGIVFFDTLGFGWVVEWDLIQQMYLDYWSGVSPTEYDLLCSVDDPPNFNLG